MSQGKPEPGAAYEPGGGPIARIAGGGEQPFQDAVHRGGPECIAPFKRAARITRDDSRDQAVWRAPCHSERWACCRHRTTLRAEYLSDVVLELAIRIRDGNGAGEPHDGAKGRHAILALRRR